jgi:hypothetical protein
MKAYSVDLRTKVVESLRRGISKSETARSLCLGTSEFPRKPILWKPGFREDLFSAAR